MATKRALITFHLDRMKKVDLKRNAKIYERDNVSALINRAIEWYAHCRENGNEELKRFLIEGLK